jgi:hypothetical protein
LVQTKIETRKQEMKQDAPRLSNLLHSYPAPSLDSMGKPLKKASISRTGPDTGRIEIRSDPDKTGFVGRRTMPLPDGPFVQRMR